MRPSWNRVTPEEIVAAILVELDQSTATGYYTNYVPNVFKVYLYGDDFRVLLPLKEKIKEDAVRALHEGLHRGNGSTSLGPPLPFARMRRRFRCTTRGFNKRSRH